ncbi:MAG: hypothetical protein ABWY06_20120 [Pseudomonas sp.]|uniref:hypothetical protein n=1 Tax=Pseudomonas sp. TaxID=306 RepID=UPI003399D796
MAYLPGLEGLNRALLGEIDDSLDMHIIRCADKNWRISPQHVADSFQITKTSAKKMLQSAVGRGIVTSLPNGWYELTAISIRSNS